MTRHVASKLGKLRIGLLSIGVTEGWFSSENRDYSFDDPS